jgi:hypothetical protein
MAGDIIQEMNGTKLSGLRQYSGLLKKYQPGDMVKPRKLRWSRGEGKNRINVFWEFYPLNSTYYA